MIKKFNEYLNESEDILTQDQKDWLNANTDGTWRVNPSTGLVDVDGRFNCRYSGLKNLMGVRFGSVSGNFFCSYNQLTSLEGAPREVVGSFDCSSNHLTSLEGAPSGVGEDFSCDNNKLTSLEGSSSEVGSGFYCYKNQLTSLEGAPREVGGNFHCYRNQITSLKGIPFVNGDIDIDPNPIWKLISPHWDQIEGMEMRSRNLVMQMIGQLENPKKEDIARIVRSLDRMDMI